MRHCQGAPAVAGSLRIVSRVIEDVRAVNLPVDGNDTVRRSTLESSSLSTRPCRRAMTVNKAKGAAAVVIDAQTGEILALGNMPTYDPNRRESFRRQSAQPGIDRHVRTARS